MTNLPPDEPQHTLYLIVFAVGMGVMFFMGLMAGVGAR